MRVLVTGWRHWTLLDATLHLYPLLEELDPHFIIEGGQDGADRAAREWARTKQLPCASVHAWWSELGKAAGPIRNAWMLELDPDVVVAWPKPGKSVGTYDMIRKAKVAGVNVRMVPAGATPTGDK